METKRQRTVLLHFPLVRLTDLPDGRSNHREAVSEILEGLKELDEYASIKMDLAKLGKTSSKERTSGFVPCIGQQKSVRVSSKTETRPRL
jgi:hypothetical protein